MKGWVLAHMLYPSPERYTDDIYPVTGPLFREYAERWDMDYRYFEMSREQIDAVGLNIATPFTDILYAGWPNRIRMLQEYEGIVWLDVDAVIFDPSEDICTTVSDEKPLGVEGWGNLAVMVVKRHPAMLELMQSIWDERDFWGQKVFWAEEAAIKRAIGKPWHYDRAYLNEGGVWVGGQIEVPREEDVAPGAYQRYHSVLDRRWNFHPSQGDIDYMYALPEKRGQEIRIMNPGGMHPYVQRVRTIIKWARLGREHRWNTE